MSAAACTGASPINQTGQGREDLTDGQEKSLTENLTCCHMAWQGQGGGAENEEAAGNLGARTVVMAS